MSQLIKTTFRELTNQESTKHPTIENGHFDRYNSFKFPKVVKLAKISLLIQIDPSSNLVR